MRISRGFLATTRAGREAPECRHAAAPPIPSSRLASESAHHECNKRHPRVRVGGRDRARGHRGPDRCAAVIYTAKDGRKYRIYDVVSVKGKGKRVALGSHIATHRVFQPATGAKLAYVFHDDDRRVTVERLAHQLAC